MRSAGLIVMTLSKLSLAILFVVAGCAPSRIAIDKTEFSRLRAEAKIPVITHKPEPFSFLSAGDNVKLGLAALAVPLGGFLVGRHAESLARTQGEEMAAANSLRDPAEKVRDGLLSALVAQLGFTNLVPLEEAFPTDDPKRMGEKLDGATVLDFKTIEWRVTPAGMGSRYRFFYRLRSRLLRTSDAKVLWQGDCRYDKDDSDATLDELTANSGELLRGRIDHAAEICATTLLVQFLGQE
jgi:hypothetical protein